MNSIKNFFKVISLLLVSYFVLMTVVMIPNNNMVKNNVSESSTLIASEGIYPEIFDTVAKSASKIDNYTDNFMINAAKKDQSNPIKAGMSIDGYSRYWHGYLVILRPILMFFSLSSIRYFNMFFMLLIFAFVVHLLAKKISTLVGLSFAVAMCSISFMVIPFCLQYSSLFYILNFSIIYLLANKKLHKNLALFGAIGSITNFLDLLTYPIITLGIPLIVVLLLNLKEKSYNQSFFESCKQILQSGIGWSLGYGITWFSKWIIASVILKKNVILDAFNAIVLRTEGSGDTAISNNNPVLNRSFMLKENMQLVFSKQFLAILAFIFIIWLLLFICFKKQFKTILKASPILIVSTFPYIWYLVLGNHSQVHYWMTFRSQAITVFGILCFAITCIDWNQVKQKFSK